MSLELYQPFLLSLPFFPSHKANVVIHATFNFLFFLNFILFLNFT